MQIGQYAIRSELGSGGIGVVYRATDEIIGREVAIKAIRFCDGVAPDDKAWREQFLLREARAIGNISHPNIVSIYHLFHEKGTAYIVMELIQGDTLEKVLRERELGTSEALKILADAASALDYAHAQMVVHCDIKPSNLMIRSDGILKIADFGIARRLTSETGAQTSRVFGTPCYMAPEQVSGEKVNGRADQFSLAVVAYQILTGQQPFQGESDWNILFQVINKDPKPAHEVNTELGPRTSEILSKALAKDPSQRFGNCTEFISELQQSFRETKVPEAEPLRSFKGRRVWFAYVAGAALLACVTLGVLIVERHEPKLASPAIPKQTGLPPSGVIDKPVPLGVVKTNEKPADVKPHRAATKAMTAQVTETLASAQPTGGPDDAAPPHTALPNLSAQPEATAPQVATPLVNPSQPPEVPLKPYTGPDRGSLIWRGMLQTNDTLVIADGKSSTGNLTGMTLPGVQVSLEFRPETVLVVEPPSAASQWRRVSVKNNGPVLPQLSITWRVASPMSVH